MTSDESTPPQDTGEPKDPPLKDNVRSRTTWLRLFFMLVVCVLYAISRIVTGAVIVLQFFWVLFSGKTNNKLEQLGQSLATYTYQIIRYLTYNTEERPFPFDADWPAGPPEP